MQKNSILVISNNLSTGRYIVDKVKLLRECDTVKVVSFIESVSILHTQPPSLILLYCENINSVEIVKAIRTLKNLDKVPVIFITDRYDEELILNAFDHGIDDFFSLDNPDSFILMRVFLTLQKSVLYKKSEIDFDIMSAAGIIDKETGLYTKEQSPLVMKTFFDKAVDENSNNTIFMTVKLLPKKNTKPDFKEAGINIKKTLRGNDITAFGQNDVFYIILNNSTAAGPESVYSRLKDKLGNKYELYSVSAQIKFPFEKTESILNNITLDLIINNGSFKFITQEEMKEAVKRFNFKEQPNQKTKKITKSTVLDIEKMVKLTFEKTKKFVNSEYKGARVTIEATDEQSIFTMKKDSYETEIIASHPSRTKVMLEIIHKNEDEILPSSQTTIYKIADLDESKLYEIFTENITLQWG